ncbi:hypothetical protein GBAR_LOCUS9044 [Geodia barretti]|uniref:Uncharacterized protein n=1 Tax=Geodia barretti TaxID=519541 RepID=A0AA35RPI2_GEOBA|nr:hypothetical protein GBAR_LOCUS9044 [Geodia barretti]
MDPSPTAAENGAEDSWSGVPIAAVLCICLVVFLAVVVCLLCVRKLLQVILHTPPYKHLGSAYNIDLIPSFVVT